MIPRDCFDSKEELDRFERDLPPLPKPKEVIRPEPTPPVIPNELKYESIPDGEIVDILARRHTQKNVDGMMFCGFNVWVKIGDVILEGWMNEFYFQKLRKKIPEDRIDLLRKIE